MPREPIRDRRSFQEEAMRPPLLRGIRRRFHRLSPCHGQVAHVLRTLPPVAAIVLLQRAAPRLACVKPAASVRSEPGSNSSLYNNISLRNPDLSFAPPSGGRNRRSRSIFSHGLTAGDKVLASCTYLFNILKELPFYLKRAAKIRTFSFPPNFF